MAVGSGFISTDTRSEAAKVNSGRDLGASHDELEAPISTAAATAASGRLKPHHKWTCSLVDSDDAGGRMIMINDVSGASKVVHSPCEINVR